MLQAVTKSQENDVHCVNGGGEEPCLQLAEGRPRPHTLQESIRMVRLVSLARAADRLLPEPRGGVGTGWGERGGSDGDVLAPLAEQVGPAAERVAEVKRLDGAVEEVGKEALERGPGKNGRVGNLERELDQEPEEPKHSRRCCSSGGARAPDRLSVPRGLDQRSGSAARLCRRRLCRRT